MLRPPGTPRRALPWAALLLLSGFQPQGARGWCSEEDQLPDHEQVKDPEFPGSVKFALQAFNQQNKDKFAYRLVRVVSASRAQVKPPLIFSMKLKLGRTICWKSEEGIDTCPLQEGPELNNTYTCFFNISPQNLAAQFNILKKSCSVG